MKYGCPEPHASPCAAGTSLQSPSVLVGVVTAAPNPDAQVPPIKWPQTVATASALSPRSCREQEVPFSPLADVKPGARPTVGALQRIHVKWAPAGRGTAGLTALDTLKPSARVAWEQAHEHAVLRRLPGAVGWCQEACIRARKTGAS